MNDRSITERAGLASMSSHLANDDHNRTDLDYVMAMGVAAARRNAEALPLMRLHLAATQADYDAALAYARETVFTLRNHNRWRLSTSAVAEVARMALAHHICPVCPKCSGLKFKVIPGSPSLSTTICPHCRGDGRRQVQAQHRHEIEATLVEMELATNRTEAAVRRVMQ